MKNNDFQLFTALKNSVSYKRLEELWMEDISDIETRRDLAAAKGQESAWRYHAGQEKGAKRLMLRLAVELARLEELEGVEEVPSDKIEKLLAEARGEQNT